MGAFFLLAGYFTPGSMERKGAGPFLWERLVRLGMPLILFVFVLGPIADIGLYLAPAPLIAEPLTWQSYWRLYPEFIGLGPLWFVAMLLIFSVGYVVWRTLAGVGSPVRTDSASPPSYLGIGLFMLLLALVSYLTRIVIPLGRTVLDFPTLAYLPQYLSFFMIGILAYRHNWFRTFPDGMGRVGAVIAAVGTLLLFPIPILGILSGSFRFLGNGTWPSAVYSLWDSIFSVSLCMAAIPFFRRYFNGENKLGVLLSEQSYTVYIIHCTTIVFIAYGLREIRLGPLLKFGLGAVIVIPVCFTIAYALRRIPGVAKIL